MITDLAQAEAELLKHQAMLVQFIEKANTETASQGKMNAETRATVEKLAATCITMTDRCIKLEQKITDFLNPENPLFGGRKAGSTIDIGGEFVKSDGYKALANGPQLGGSHRMMFKTAIINATGTLQPLVPPDYKPAIITAPLRRLRMRDVMTVGQTDSNMISFPKENVFTNNAGPQISGSPQQFENVTKPESAITFTLANEPVCTIAHWIPASKQVLADAPMLASYINGRLMYGLKLKEDTEILLGTGANGRVQGLYTNRTAYSVASPTLYTTKLDVIRDAIRQAENNEYEVNAIVLNTTDWAKIELSKDSTGRYLFANPQDAAQPRLWGLPIVVTNSLTAGTFLVGSFDQAAGLWDREEASVEVGLDGNNFTKNMVTILCEERLCVTIYRATAIVGGAFLA